MFKKSQDPNVEVRLAIQNSGLLYWQIADKMNIRPDKFSILLRHPLSEENLQAVYSAIKAIKEEANDQG